MDIQLSDHFSYTKLLRFTLPSMGVMIAMSIYSVVDGFFVSNFAGKVAFAAMNFIWPFLMIIGSVGLMFGSGGSALIGKLLGEGERERANEIFTMLILFALLVGLLLTALGELLLRPVLALFTMDEGMLEQCVLYGRILLLAMMPFLMTFAFQSLFVTAEKPKMGFVVTLVSGCFNILLDAVLVAGLHLGLGAAAAATALSQLLAAVIPLAYFLRPNSSLLHFTRPRWDGAALRKICSNGISELLSNISFSVVGILYNVQFLKYVGPDGVAAYGVLMYVSMIFEAIYMGYCMGSAPVVSYHYGADDRAELHSLLWKSLHIIGVVALCMTVFSQLMARPLAYAFTGYDADLMAMTVHGFRIYSITFLFSGFGIYGSSFFTALNNGPTSAWIAFLRTMVFEIAAVLLLPLWIGADGIWLAVAVADFMAMLLAFFFLRRRQERYGY